MSGDIETLVSTATSVSADPDPLLLWDTETDNGVGQNVVTVTATVTNTSGTSEVPAGSVNFFDLTDNIDLGSATLDENGKAALGIPSLSLGSYNIIAKYIPTGDFAGSTGEVTEPVQVFTTTTITAAPALGLLGQPATVTATVANDDDGDGGAPTGAVEFVDATSSQSIDLGTAPLVNGSASISTTFSTPGEHNILAFYTATGNFAGGQAFSTVAVEAADVWNNPAGGNWDDPANWSDGVPDSSDDVAINAIETNAVITLGPDDRADNLTASTSTTFAGGQLTILGTLTDSGPLTLAAGAMIDAPGSFALQNVTVQEESTLSGQGTVHGDLVNDGELDMGDTVGTIVVTGDYIQGASATLSVKIGGSSASEFDQISVLGIATLDGTLNAQLLNAFNPSPGAPLTIVKLANSAVGDFSTFLSPSTDGVLELDPLNTPDGLGVADNTPGDSVSVTYPGQPNWQPEGPDTIANGPRTVATPDNGSVGAIQSVVVAPDGTVYVGTVGGGVWRTNLLTEGVVQQELSTHPGFLPLNFYTPLTDQETSLAVSTMALDPTDPSGDTLWVGTGSLSSALGSTISPNQHLGGPSVGLLMTTNRGQSWQDFGAARFNTPILSIVPLGQVILVGTDGQGLWQSTDGGASFTQVSYGFSGVELTNASVSTIVADPQYPGRFYAALSSTSPRLFTGDTMQGSNTIMNVSITPGSYGVGVGEAVSGPGIPSGTTISAVSGTTITLSNAATQTNTGASFRGPSTTTSGVYESVNGGSAWFEIDGGISQIVDSPNLVLTASAGGAGTTNLFVVTTQVPSINPVDPGSNLVTGAWRAEISSNPLANLSWVDTPAPTSANNSNYANYGHFDAVPDPANPNLIYVCGWQQCLFRVDTTPGDSSWTLLSLNSFGEPHDDIRSLTFLNNSTLLATCDGGIYGLPDSRTAAGKANHWVDLNVDVQDTEFFQVAYDSIDGLIVGGAQDNGTSIQIAPGLPIYQTLSAPVVSTPIGNFGSNSVGGGDGGAVAVDNYGSTANIWLTDDGYLSWYNTRGGANENGELNSGFLTPADQKAYKSNLKTDASYPIASNQNRVHGILLGMTSLYFVDVTEVAVIKTPGMTGSVRAASRVSTRAALRTSAPTRVNCSCRTNRACSSRSRALFPLWPGVTPYRSWGIRMRLAPFTCWTTMGRSGATSGCLAPLGSI